VLLGAHAGSLPPQSGSEDDSVTQAGPRGRTKWTNADGTPGEETVWFQVSAWGKLAEVCNEYLSKGRRVLVEGRLRPDPETSRLAFFFSALTSLTFSAIL